MSAHASKATLFAALAANAGIAIAKFAGAAYTGSAAMASEGIHSLVDTGNQVLLLFGMKDASRPADASHPFGYGLRLYFWGFVVAMAVFALGSGVAIYEGAEKVAHPEPIHSAWVNVVILLVAILLEGSSLTVALRHVRQEARRRGLSMRDTLRRHRDPTVFAVVYEETAALAGLFAALIGIGLAVLLDMPVLDGWTSIIIGVILAITALSLARRCYVLMTGQAADPAIEDRLREILARVKPIEQVNEVRTMHFGPSEVLVLVSADFVDDTLAGTVERIVSDVEDGIRQEFAEVRRVYIEAQSSDRHRDALQGIGEDVDALERDEEDDVIRRDDPIL
ncbi:cation diffusion facilitator family transporter [Sphingomonas sp.]|uniref:cation diffusion facilitator family transporter n=1 Tax=Sphingomonas sp. TaxID=28214 RepID=UPI003B3AAC03